MQYDNSINPIGTDAKYYGSSLYGQNTYDILTVTIKVGDIRCARLYTKYTSNFIKISKCK